MNETGSRRIAMKLKTPVEFRRWATLRCAHCGHRFRWSRDARFSTGNRDGLVYHAPCLDAITWRRTAEDRLIVMDMVADVAGVDEPTMQGFVQMRAHDEGERVAFSNLVWRVFYDCQKRLKAVEGSPS